MSLVYFHAQIWCIICLGHLSYCTPKHFQEGKLETLADEICSEEKLMLRSGLPWRHVLKLMDDKIENLTNIGVKRYIPDSSLNIGLKRDTQVGSYGQSIKSTLIGLDQATISNEKNIVLDFTNNDFDESEVKVLRFSQPPILPAGRKDMRRNTFPNALINNSECRMKVINELSRRFANADSMENQKNGSLNKFPGMVNFIDTRPGSAIELKESRATGNEGSSGSSTEDKTSIKSHGYNIDFSQTASGNSQNSVSSAIKDIQSHSTFKASKISSIGISTASDADF
ncbi:uncharacterized protein LOC141857952 isoform X1 [Brevipalpus obovatus]|uniref:uncharacterized protein LOC141857952 isoform X1 n=1 Tax=Brevipalpus obovatus TaxID=246614 RepID=UPI003D9F47DF